MHLILILLESTPKTRTPSSSNNHKNYPGWNSTTFRSFLQHTFRLSIITVVILSSPSPTLLHVYFPFSLLSFFLQSISIWTSGPALNIFKDFCAPCIRSPERVLWVCLLFAPLSRLKTSLPTGVWCRPHAVQQDVQQGGRRTIHYIDCKGKGVRSLSFLKNKTKKQNKTKMPPLLHWASQNSTLHAGKVSSCMATVLLLPRTVMPNSLWRSWVSWYQSCIISESNVGISVNCRHRAEFNYVFS